MVSALVSAAIAAGTSIYGGIKKSQAAREQRRREQAELDMERAENRNWYNRRYYEDVSQRADVQYILNNAKQTLTNNINAIAGRTAVSGGSNASVAAAKEKANQAYANATASAVAQGMRYKDNVETQYRQAEKQNSAAQRASDRYYGEANQAAIDGAVTGLIGAAGSAIGAFAQNDSATRAANTVASAASGTTTTGANITSSNQVNPVVSSNVTSGQLANTQVDANGNQFNYHYGDPNQMNLAEEEERNRRINNQAGYIGSYSGGWAQKLFG